MTSQSKGDGPSLPRPSEQSVKVALRDGWGRVLEGQGLAGRLATLFILVLLAVGSGLLLGPRGHQAIPYDADDVGRFAVGTVKAYRNYRIEDHTATEHRREEARESVLAVYDYEVDATEQIVRRIREAFGHMQKVWADHQIALAANEARLPQAPEDAKEEKPEAHEEGEDADSDSAPSEGGPEVAQADPVAEALALFQSHKDTFLQQLQLPLDDASFDALALERFSSQIEQSVVRLVRDGMTRPIIADQQLIAADRMRGITLRPVPVRDVRNERVLRDVAGEVRDLAMARAALNERLTEVMPDSDPASRAVTGRLARRLVRPTLVYNRDETDRRRDQAEAGVRATFIELEAGEKIIGDGERIEARHLVIFKGIREQAAASSTMLVNFGAGLLAVLIALSVFAFAHSGVWRFRPTRKDLLFLAVTLLGALLAVRGGMFLADALADRMPGISGPLLYYALPAGAAVVLVRLVLSAEVTLVFAVVLASLVGVLADHSLGLALFTFVGGLVAALQVSKARDRGGIWRAGMLMAVVNVALVAAFGVQEGREVVDIYPAMISGGVAGAIMPVLVLGLAILVENVFRYTTDLKLLELANMNNALLKELVVAAPGTYHHSMMIGSMVESAAEAIGANPLLARVGAYYHDIGKGKSPLYFAENQRGGENPHDKLTPSMSALIIRRHVTDGIKMARAAGLPAPLIDMIPMHHGTRLKVFFFHKAKEDAEKRGEPFPSETEYRYAGPKPRFREAALLMIADSVEAAARTLVEPTTDRLRGLVQKVINACFADGQFDECNITLKDLHAITRSFVTSLEAIHHTRPEYHQPADKSSEKPKNGDRPKVGERPAERGAAGGQETKGGEVDPRQAVLRGESGQARPKVDTERSAPPGKESAAPGGPDAAPPGQPEVEVMVTGDDGAALAEDGSESRVEALKRLGTG